MYPVVQRKKKLKEVPGLWFLYSCPVLAIPENDKQQNTYTQCSSGPKEAKTCKS